MTAGWLTAALEFDGLQLSIVAVDDVKMTFDPSETPLYCPLSGTETTGSEGNCWLEMENGRPLLDVVSWCTRLVEFATQYTGTPFLALDWFRPDDVCEADGTDEIGTCCPFECGKDEL